MTEFNHEKYLESEGIVQREGHTGMFPEVYEYLSKFFEQNKPKNILEIGFNLGHSASFFLGYCEKLTSTDIGNHPYAKANKIPKKFKEVYGDRFEFHQGDSRQFLKTLKGDFDFIFVDGGHDYGTASSDLDNCKKLCTGFVCLDDYVKEDHLQQSWNKGVVKAWQDKVEKKIINELMSVTVKNEHNQYTGLAIGIYN